MDEVVKRTAAMGVMDEGNGCGLVGRVLASSNERKKKQLISSNKARRNRASLSLNHTKRTVNETIKMSI